jgi:hypothetical protein
MLFFLADGRLGNQIFQYSFLKSVAKKNELIISTSMNQLSKLFDLDNNNFKQIPTNKYIYILLKKIIKPYFIDFLIKIRLLGYLKQNRNETSALPTFEKRKGLFNITIVESNFFQCESFFDTSKFKLTIKNIYMAQARKDISHIESHFTKVFVHVRRGDYVFEKYLNQTGIDLSRNYYINAINLISEQILNPYFIILSDDPSYCECCFDYLEPKYISRNSVQIDFSIMTLCANGIVSNSSFSWWGAYLMDIKNIVIYPKYWFGWKNKTESHIGIQPKTGIIIDPTNSIHK